MIPYDICICVCFVGARSSEALEFRVVVRCSTVFQVVTVDCDLIVCTKATHSARCGTLLSTTCLRQAHVNCIMLNGLFCLCVCKMLC